VEDGDERLEADYELSGKRTAHHDPSSHVQRPRVSLNRLKHGDRRNYPKLFQELDDIVRLDQPGPTGQRQPS